MAKATTLQEVFKKNVLPKLAQELGRKNPHALPHVKAIHVNVGIGKHITTVGKDYEYFVENIKKITGQKPVVTITNKSISNFKLREGTPSGVVVTLRKKRMYDFLNKLINVVFPRIRDFRGISPKSFDGHGNYSIGIQEHVAFPEIHGEDVDKIHGLQITIETTAKTDDEGRALLKHLGFPFKTK